MSAKILTVSELTQQIKDMLTGEFGSLWVEGEIRDFKVSPSGHAHFVLTDGESTLRCVIFGYWSRSASRMRLKDGLYVRSFGRVDVYPRGGYYQQIVEVIVPWGAGMVEARLEALKRKLAAEGLFDREKKPIPRYIQKIGLVTSPAGAALRDFLRTLNRVKGFRVIFVPVVVQGADAPRRIAKAIKKLNKVKDIDVIVVTRGGGSREDLSAFNEEPVVRAVAESSIPVISAVGHSIDTTLTDLAADLHLFTPTAAAELIVNRRLALIDQLNLLKFRLANAMNNIISWKAQRLSTLGRVIESLSPVNRLRLAELKLRNLSERLRLAIEKELSGREATLRNLSVRLEALDPLSVLRRGYSVVFSETGEVLSSVDALETGMKVKVMFMDGISKMEVLEIEPEEREKEKGEL